MTFDEWISRNESNPPTGFECVGAERMRQIWNAAQTDERETCAKKCDEASRNTDVGSRCFTVDAYAGMAKMLRSNATSPPAAPDTDTPPAP